MTTRRPSATVAAYGNHEVITPENKLHHLSASGRWSPAKRTRSRARNEQ